MRRNNPINARCRSTAIVLLLASTTTCVVDHQARAQSYPERTIKIVVPFPPGGPTDVAARLASQALAYKMTSNVVIENVAGAGGRIGAKHVADANKDGYTLLLGGTNVNAIFGAMYKNLGFDPLSSFAPIAAICADSMVLAIHPSVPADTVQELVQYAKEHPGKLSYGAVTGIYTHFASEYFKVKTGTDILHVPYKGGPLAITDLLGGHIQIVFNPKSTLLGPIKDGKLKGLAVTSDARWPELPNTPTMNEVGISGFPKDIAFGLLAPAGTPGAIIDQLNAAMNEGLRSDKVRASLQKIGLESRIGTAQDFAGMLAEQENVWRVVVEEAGIKAE
jgi:tripartite-type tricarboxylate transporter receptor subunit TctC